MDSLLAGVQLDEDTRAQVLDKAGGNPLYAEEFARMLADRGIQTATGDSPVPTSVPVPDTVHAIIAARLDTLPPERKAILLNAAVVGKSFWPGAVAALGGPTDPNDELRGLARKEFCRRTRRSTIENETEYAFWHVLVQDVAYGLIPRAERAQKHRAAAQWLEQVAGERVFDHAELLAHHYTRAIELAQASGLSQLTVELVEPAYRFLMLAGDRAMALDLGRAATLYEQAVAVLADDDPRRADSLFKFGRAAWQAGEALTLSRELLEAAISGYEARGDASGAGDAMAVLSVVQWNAGNTQAGKELAAGAVSCLESAPESAALVRALYQLAAKQLLSGDPAECLKTIARAMPIAESIGLDPETVKLRVFRGLAQYDLGRVEALDDLEHTLELALRRNLSNEAAICYMNYGEALRHVAGPAPALEVLNEGLDFAEHRGLVNLAIIMRTTTCEIHFDMGEWDRALEVAEAVGAADTAQGGHRWKLGVDVIRALIHCERGDLAEAQTLVDESLPMSQTIGEPDVVLPWLCVAAEVARKSGDLDTAGLLADEFRDAAKASHGPGTERRLYALRTLVSRGDVQAAQRFLDAMPNRVVQHRHADRSGLAALKELQNDHETAMHLYEEAARNWEDFGNVPHRAEALLGQGRCLAALGRVDDADRILQSAKALYTGLDALPWMKAAEDAKKRRRFQKGLSESIPAPTDTRRLG